LTAATRQFDDIVARRDLTGRLRFVTARKGSGALRAGADAKRSDEERRH
jgi:release factor glutamine methyltransferase